MPLLQKGYLGSTPLFKEQSWFEFISSKPVNVSAEVTLTANASAHTKGSWTQLIASTSENSSLLVVDYTGHTVNTDTATLLDIGTGASGSETAIIENVAIGGGANRQANRPTSFFAVPIRIASGQRIAARIQSVVTGGKTVSAVARIFNMGDYAYAPTAVDVIGTSTATSAGTAMSGSSGTWVQVTASTSNAYKGIVIVPSVTDGAIADIFAEYRVGAGASGSESEIGRIRVQHFSEDWAATSPLFSTVMGASIPSGTRLSVRHDIAANPSRYDVTLIGIR